MDAAAVIYSGLLGWIARKGVLFSSAEQRELNSRHLGIPNQKGASTVYRF